MRRGKMLRLALQELLAMSEEPGFDPSDVISIGEALMLRIEERTVSEGHRWTAVDWRVWVDFLMKWLPILLKLALIFCDEEDRDEDDF